MFRISVKNKLTFKQTNMETLITKRLKVSKMHKIFDAQHDDFMVKYFKPKNSNVSEKIEMEDVINFEILIRHNDEMEAKTLFNKALKTHPWKTIKNS